MHWNTWGFKAVITQLKAPNMIEAGLYAQEKRVSSTRNLQVVMQKSSQTVLVAGISLTLGRARIQ